MTPGIFVSAYQTYPDATCPSDSLRLQMVLLEGFVSRRSVLQKSTDVVLQDAEGVSCKNIQNNGVHPRIFSSSQVQRMASGECGSGSTWAQLSVVQQIKEETPQKKRVGNTEQLQSREKLFFKRGPPKTTSNTGGEANGGREGGSWGGLMR